MELRTTAGFFNDSHTSVSDAVKHHHAVSLSNRRLYGSQGPISTHLSVRLSLTPLYFNVRAAKVCFKNQL